MDETELKIMFPTEKLDALRFFIEKKDLSVEQELKDYLDKTYEKFVPPQVREYVESKQNDEPRPSEATAAPEQEVQRERQPRLSRRQREQSASESSVIPAPQPEETGPAENENQGLSMSM